MLPNLVVLNLTLLGFFGGAAQLEHLVGDGVDKRIDALARKSGNLEHARSLVDAIGEFIAVRGSDGVFAYLFLQAAHGVFGAGNVDLVGNHDARTLRQFIGVHRKLVVDDAVIFHRIAAFIAARHIDDMHDERGALDMAQEFMAQALALVQRLR